MQLAAQKKEADEVIDVMAQLAEGSLRYTYEDWHSTTIAGQVALPGSDDQTSEVIRIRLEGVSSIRFLCPRAETQTLAPVAERIVPQPIQAPAHRTADCIGDMARRGEL